VNKRIIPLLLLVATVLPACQHYVSSIPTANNVNGDAWYSTRKMFKSKVWYCPPASNGPATCTEAKMVPQGKK
jgi:hypothetical protein